MKTGIIGGSSGLGKWMVQFLRKKGWEVRFSSADQLSETAGNAELAEWAELVILAVPIRAMEQTLAEIYPLLHGKWLADLSSVKTIVVEEFYRLAAVHPQVQPAGYASIHPMFGPSLRTLSGQVVLLNHFYGSEAQFEPLLDAFRQEGALLYSLEYQQHDRIMGVVQGLNHFNVFVAASVLERMSGELGHIRHLASPPYRIFLIFCSRYVLQQPALYADIQFFNPFVAHTLEVFMEEAARLRHIIGQKDREAFCQYVENARRYFAENQDDVPVSDHLIEQLGAYEANMLAGRIMAPEQR